MPLVPQPPSGFTGVLRDYLRVLAAAMNLVPNVSYFTASTPEGLVRGSTGDLAIYVGDASSLTHLWVKSSDGSTAPSLTSWKAVA